MSDWEGIRGFAEAAMSLFVIVDPIGSLPFLVSLTAGTSDPQRKRLVRIAGVAALAIICAIAVAGNFLLHTVFHVSIDEFAFGGGLLLVVVGVRGILKEPEESEITGQGDSRRVVMAVSPIACPLLVGPGAIVTTTLIVYQHGIVYGLGACLTAFTFVILILNYSHLLFKLMGPVVTLAIGRIMDVFIVAIGVQFLVKAIKAIFPAIAG